MSIPELCERIQETWLSQTISQSTWGYPIVGALHVLAIAIFGGTMLVTSSQLLVDVRLLKRVGLTVVIVTGAVLFASGAARYYDSASFKIKMALLLLLLLNAGTAYWRQRDAKLHSGISLVLWAAVIFAARGIAFF